MLQLSVDDGENRSCRNKTARPTRSHLWGDLRATVTAIFNRLDKPPTAELELDWVHRVQGPIGEDALSPRDVLARVHFYTVKEEIMRQAWVKGPVDFDGAAVHLFPDLLRFTLRMRGMLRPLLDAIRNAGATYRWGHPFHLAMLKGGGSFILRWPDQLSDLFTFLESLAIPIPDWLDFPITFGNTRPASPRPQRCGRRRQRSRPRADSRDTPIFT